MAQPVTLNICHLYPDLMDTYGDKGNIIAVTKRCQWRGIKVNLSAVSVGDALNNDFDFYFFGGGQDKAQTIVGRDLQKKAKDLDKSIDEGAVMLSICGGYQLLQNYFKTKDGEEIKGISLFDAYTQGSSNRMIQNLLIEVNPELKHVIKSRYSSREERSDDSRSKSSSSRLRSNNNIDLDQLIGFENHSGKTYLGSGVQPLGTVLIGAGNNGEDQTEGAVYKNAFGCYLHGSLLPKNPHFADYLISKALERRYGKIELEPLDDTIEWQAHKSTVKKIRSTR